MAFLMYDSVTVSQLPVGAYAYAGYGDGRFNHITELRAKFPHAHILEITVTGNPNADVHKVTAVDVEQYDASNATALAFVRAKLAQGTYRPVVYTSASNASTLIAVLRAGGIGRNSYRLWTAHYTDNIHYCALHTCGYGDSTLADATQFADAGQLYAHSRNVDVSVVAVDFFAPAPVPVKPVAKPVVVGQAFEGPNVVVLPGYYWWKASNSVESLDKFAAKRNTTSAAILAHSRTAPYAPVNRAKLEAYAKDTSKLMPAGLVFYTSNGA